MEGMDNVNHNMDSIEPPPSINDDNDAMPHRKIMMHMTFFGGTAAEVLFSKWPGTNTVPVCIAWPYSSSSPIKAGSGHVAAGLVQTLLHCLRVGLGYIYGNVGMAVMSFNAALVCFWLLWHTLGFFLFGSRVEDEKGSDLPPTSC